MKKLLTSIILLTLSASVFSQNFNISGQIKDKTSNNPIIYAYVKILNSSDSLLLSGVTDDKGFFNVPLQKGDYKFAFEQMGYTSDTELVSITESKFLGTFKLKVNDKEIGEITVSGQSHKNYIDKDVQVITQDKRAGAANTFDVMERVQGLSYDRYNNQIKVDNSTNIIILVNGIEKDAEYIKNLDPSRLLRIEIMRSPSGKYAVAGYDAVINVILKDNYKGIDLVANENNMFCFFDPKSAIWPINNSYASLNTTNSKVNFYATYYFNRFNFIVPGDRLRTYADSTHQYYLAPDPNAYNLQITSQTHNLTVGNDYIISPKHTVSLELSAKYTPFETNLSQSKYEITSDVLSFKPISDITNEKSGNQTYSGTIYYIGNYNDNNSLNSSFTFSNFINKVQDVSKINDIVMEQNTSNNQIFTTFNTEYYHGFSKKFGATFGYGNNFKKLDNTFELNDSNKTFTYHEIRNQAYVYFKYQPKEFLGIKFGTAFEYTVMDNSQQSVSFPIWMPYLDINFKPSPMFDATIKYRSKSNYPEISQLNPFEVTSEFKSVTVGNPNLKPANDNTVSLRMNVMQGLLSLEPYYEFTDNYIIQTLDFRSSDSIWVFGYANAGKYSKRGLKINLTIPFGKSIFFQNSANIYHEAIQYEGKEKTLNYWTMNSQLIYVNKKINTVVGFLYQKTLQRNLTWTGYNSWNNDFWGIFIQQPFFKQKLNVMVLYFIPTNFGANYNQGSYTESPFYTEYNNVHINLIKNMFMFNISYRFNKGKEITKRDNNVNLEDNSNQKKLF